MYYRSSLPLDCDGSDGHTVIGRVVLARNPCHALSDIQTATAVDLGPRFQTMSAEGEWWPRHLIDVLVFPATGRVSLASLLSGGDYDGDIVWMCWDDRLLPASKMTASAPHRSVPDVLTAPLTDYWSHSDGAEAYLSSFDDCTLHLATNLHLAWVDKLLSRLSSKPSASRLECGSHPAVCHLAKLCADMVDAPKTGSIGSVRSYTIDILEELSFIMSVYVTDPN